LGQFGVCHDHRCGDFPIFYAEVAGAGLPDGAAGNYFGYTNSIAMLCVAAAAPILGAIADYRGVRKRLLGFFAFVGILFTLLLVLIRTGDWFLASCLFIGGNLGWAGANIFYDSLLPHVARPEDLDRISARGYAMGYLGGGLLLGINLVMIRPISSAWKIPRYSQHRLGRPSVVRQRCGVVGGVHPSAVPARGRTAAAAGPEAQRLNPVRVGFQRVGHTFRDLRRYRQLFKFLIAFWLYNDGIGTIIHMAAIFGKPSASPTPTWSARC